MTSSLTAQLTITNPSPAPILISSITLQCRWGGTVPLPCGSLSNANNFNTGSFNSFSNSNALVIPASGSTQCQFSNFPLATSATINYQQPCQIVIVTSFGTSCPSSDFTLDLMNPTFKNNINNCIDYSVNCQTTRSTTYYNPIPGGGVTSSLLCADATNPNIPLIRDFTVAVSGGFSGDGTQQGACSGSAEVTCSSGALGVTTVGSGGFSQNQQAASASSTVTFNPVECPLPPPSPSPSPPPTNQPGGPNAPGTGFLGTGSPVVAVTVQDTVIQGSFDWQVTASATPSEVTAAVGDSATSSFAVQLSRVPASDAAPPRFFIRGYVSVSNPLGNTGALQISGASALVGTTQQPLACATADGGGNVPFPYSLAVGAALRCQFYFEYSSGSPMSNTIYGRASILTPQGETTPTDSNARADFSFSGATSAVADADGVCAGVYMVFNTDYLSLTRTLGVMPSFDNANPDRVCEDKTYTFDVAMFPREGTPCGPQKVLATVFADYPRNGSTVQRQGRTEATVTATGACAGNQVSDVAGGTPPPLPVGGNPSSAGEGESTDAAASSSGPVAVQVQGVTSRDGDNTVWGLEMRPAQAEVDADPAGTDVLYNLIWTKTATKDLELRGNVVLRVNGPSPLTLDTVTVEMVDRTAPNNPTVAQADALCPKANSSASTVPAEVSSSSPLVIDGSVTCTFIIKAPVTPGAALTATVSLTDSGTSLSSSAVAISQFTESGAASGCAVLLSGVAATNLAAADNGRITAVPEGVVGPQVCEAGSQQVKFRVPPPPPGTPCGDYAVTSLAALTPARDTTRAPIFANATTKLRVLTGCVIEVNQLALSVTSTRVLKTRIMKWSITRTTAPPVNDSASEQQQPLQLPVVQNLTDVFTRSLQPGQFLQVSGVVSATTRGSDVTPLQQIKVVAIPLCTGQGQCAASVQASVPSCNFSNPSAGVCSFRFDKLPSVGALLLPMLDVPVPEVYARLLSPNNPVRRAVLGNCANISVSTPTVLPDGQGVVVSVANVINAPPSEPVCSTSWVTTRQVEVRVAGACTADQYAVSSQAQAKPIDAAADAVTAVTNLAVACPRHAAFDWYMCFVLRGQQ
eukprot:gene10001-10155_t